jgi:hypothetical protein
MALFDVITGLGSLYGGIQQDAATRKKLAEAKALQQQGLDLEESAVNNFRRFVENLKQQGAFDPTKQLAAAQKQRALQTRNAFGSVATNLANLGYRPGDSPFYQQGARISEEANLAGQLQDLSILNQFRDREMGAEQSVSEMIRGLGRYKSGLGQQMYGQELPMQNAGISGAFRGLVGGGLSEGIAGTLGGRTKKPSSNAVTSYIKGKGTEQFAKNIAKSAGKTLYRR